MPHVLQPPIPREQVVNQVPQVLSTVVNEPPNKPPHPGGRPPIPDEVVSYLVVAFQRGFTDTRACQFAKISRQTFYKYMREDQGFADKVRDAKYRWTLLASDTITEILESKDSEIVGVRASMAKWIYEKEMPEKYGNVKIDQQNNLQNNFYVFDTKQLSDIRQQSDIGKTSPAKLFETLKDRSQLDAGGEEGRASSIHQGELSDLDTEVSSMPRPSSTV